MKNLKYLLLIFILFLTPRVYAAEFNMNSYTSATNGGTKNRYRATEIYNTGTSGTFTFGTRYTGRISDIETFFSYPFEENTTYRFTYNMSTEDFRNNFSSSYWWDCSDTMTDNNAHVFSVNYISYKKIQFSIKPSENTTCIRVWVRSSSISNIAITGVNNWNLSSITLYDPDWQSGSGSGQGSSPAPTSSPNSNQDIINNQNNNTQDIINNNNENTNNIIENNNNNTQEIIDNQNKNTDSINQQLGTCFTNIFDKDKFMPFIQGFKLSGLTAGKQYKFYASSPFSWFKISDGVQGVGYYEYFGDNIQILTFTAPENVNDYWLFLGDSTNWTNNSSWFYNNATLMLYSSPFPPNDIEFIGYNEKTCTSKIDETTDAINQQNQYLMDNSDPSISDNEFLSMFNSIGIHDPLNYLLTLPTQLINKIVSLSDTCTAINLGSLYGTMLSLPCINLESILGSSVWSIIDVIFSVSLLVVILKNLYDTFSNLLTMGAEKEAKEKFSMPTPMDFLALILGGDSR